MQGRVFITGDKHGSMRMLFGISEKKLMGENDVLIITGDTGYVQDGDYPHKIRTIERLFPGTLCFIDGNHDNHEILSSLPISLWNGGRVHMLGERVCHLMRGELYSIHGSNFFTLGGARTVANFIEGEEGVDWWPGEEPAAEELRFAKEQFMSNIGNIDFIVTHEAPLSAREGIPRLKRVDADYILPGFLQELLEYSAQDSRLKKWYFGHMHVDLQLGPVLRAIYNNLVEAGSEKTIRWF